MKHVAALYVRSDTVYQSIAGVDCWDVERDARLYDGPHPVVAHPPCKTWGRFWWRARDRDTGDGGCGEHAVRAVRRWGGVLEHPKDSGLWHRMMLPRPGYFDHLGGHTLAVEQCWWGHEAVKPTWLYVVG
ncbi:MAG TPA: hypothetical protein VJ925_08085, partial [Longimicrobiales bacterium]|nr:hypothetical protein [Longimicrobiales bacterium]